jgi:hypothetical protein
LTGMVGHGKHAEIPVAHDTTTRWQSTHDFFG